ncbi:MAG: AsmA-like C-terminal domain-containing protein [Syntrophaceae bacterium]|nr:AsmA-like C-terminal domain-containing protein [Syntrophaceae bacterium]
MKSKSKKAFVWSVRIILGLVITAILAASYYVHTQSTQDKIRAIINKEFNNSVSYERAHLGIFPGFGLVFDKVDITVPEGNHINAASVKMHPRLVSLLKGSFKIGKLTFYEPDILLNVSVKKKKAKDDYLTLEQIIESANAILDELRNEMPGLIAVVKKGKLVIRENNEAITDISDLKARITLSSKDVKIRIKGDMVKWGKFSLISRIHADKNTLFINDLSAFFGKSSIFKCSGKVEFKDSPYWEIKSNKAILILDEIFNKISSYSGLRNILGSVNNLSGKITLSSLNIAGDLTDPQNWNISAYGSIEDAVYGSSSLPGLVKITRGRIEADNKKIIFDKFETSIFDSKLDASAFIERSGQDISSADISFSGTVGKETIQWISQELGYSREETLRAPVSITSARVLWQKEGKIFATGSATINNGPKIMIDLEKDNQALAVNKLIITDNDSSADIAFKFSPNLLELSFKGNLNEQTLNRMFEQSSFPRGWVKGDFSASLRLDKYQQSVVRGKLEGRDFILPLPLREPLKFKQAVITGRNQAINIESAELLWGENNLEGEGSLKAVPEGIRLDINLTSDAIEVENIINIFSTRNDSSNNDKQASGFKKPALRGIIRVNTPKVSWGKYSASPANADIILASHAVHLVIKETYLCDIAIPGRITFLHDSIKFNFRPDAQDEQLDSTLNCLLEKDFRITGKFGFKGDLNSEGNADKLKRELRGNVEFHSKDGVIQRAPLLVKIFAVLNVTELLRGKLPDFTTEGFKYNSINIKGNIDKGVFVIQEAVVDGTTMQLVGQGEVDLVTDQIKLTVLVAPFKTIDFLVSKIPGVRYILGGTLISIPLRVTGDLNDPSIVVMSPTAIGSGLIGMMKRTLNLPVKIIEPIMPKEQQ